MVRLSKRCARAHVGKWRLRTVGWFMQGCVAFNAYCHTGRGYKWKIKSICVKRAAVDLVAVALCIYWRVGEARLGQYSVKCVARTGGFFSMGFV